MDKDDLGNGTYIFELTKNMMIFASIRISSTDLQS